MTPLSKILSFFPFFVILMISMSFLWLCISPGWLPGLALIFAIYGLPLLTYRIHQYFYPVKEGVSYLCGQEYSPWWGSHQIQWIYIAFSGWEKILRLIPGLFSVWLRLWGAKIGQGVYWNPEVEITDRGLLEVGDRAIIGHRVGIYAHVIKPKNNDLMLYVKKVKIGNHVFLGSASRLGPGVTLKDGVYIPVKTDILPNQIIDKS